MGRRLLFLTQYDESGASSRIRSYQFFPYLEKLGYQVEVRPLIRKKSNKVFAALATEKSAVKLLLVLADTASNYLRRYAHVVEGWRYDAVVVQKDVLPFGLRALLKFGQRNVVYEFDDAIWFDQHSKESVGWVQKLVAAYRKKLLENILKDSRLAIVDNSFLKQFSEDHCKNILTLTAPIDTRLYRVQKEPTQPVKALGWIGSPGTTYLLQGLLPAIDKLSESVPICLYNIGGLPLSSSKFTIHNVPWSVENELKYLAKFDLGLMPLDDRPFNRGRFGYKLVQYFSAGVPTLAADLGLNREAVFPGVNGLLYQYGNAEDFVSKARQILENPELLQTLSRKSRQIAEETYDTQVQAGRMAQAIEQLL